MINTKKSVLKFDILSNKLNYNLKSKLEKSEQDIKNGRVMSIEESKERMRNKYEGFTL